MYERTLRQVRCSMYEYFDLNVWGTVQDRVYKTKPTSIHNLRDRKVSEVEHMSEQDIKNSIESFYDIDVKWYKDSTSNISILGKVLLSPTYN